MHATELGLGQRAGRREVIPLRYSYKEFETAANKHSIFKGLQRSQTKEHRALAGTYPEMRHFWLKVAYEEMSVQAGRCISDISSLLFDIAAFDRSTKSKGGIPTEI